MHGLQVFGQTDLGEMPAVGFSPLGIGLQTFLLLRFGSLALSCSVRRYAVHTRSGVMASADASVLARGQGFPPGCAPLAKVVDSQPAGPGRDEAGEQQEYDRSSVFE